MAGIMGIRRLSQVLLKPIVIILVVALGIGLFFIGFPRYRAGNERFVLYKGPAAKVNGVQIKDEDFNKILMQIGQQYGSFWSDEQLKEETLKYVVNQELIAQAIKERKIKVTKDEIEEFLKKLRKVYKTEEQMDNLIMQVGAKDMKGLKKLIEEQLQRQHLFAQLAKEEKLEVSEDEIKERYEVIEMAHILVATNKQVTENPLSEAEALKKAEEAYQKIQNGGDFAEVAKEYSDDTSNKDNGGLLGRGTIASYKNGFVKEFMDAALQLNVGEVSAPVKTPYGYHLIKVIDKKLAEGSEWEKEKATIRNELLAEKFVNEGKIDSWLKGQLDKADVVILDPALRAYRLRSEEKWPEAAQAYEKALNDKRYKNKLNIYISAAEVYKEAKNYEMALDVLDRVPKEFRGEMDVYLTKAKVYNAKGDQEEVKKVLAAAQEKAGESVQDLREVLNLMKEFKLEDEAKALEEKIAQVEEEKRQEQEELEKMLQEEKEKVKETAESSEAGGNTAVEDNNDSQQNPGNQE